MPRNVVELRSFPGGIRGARGRAAIASRPIVSVFSQPLAANRFHL
jgi:hypothetical protein